MKVRIPSFTIVEVIVAMVLSTIVVAIAYRVYNYATISFLESQKTYDRMNALITIQSIMNHDFQMANGVTFNDSIITISKSKNQIISYQLTSACIVRNNYSSNDTFKVALTDLHIKYLFDIEPFVERIEFTSRLNSQVDCRLTATVFYSNEIKFNYSKNRERN
jgi:Tfp pilus assembly protein PilW